MGRWASATLVAVIAGVCACAGASPAGSPLAGPVPPSPAEATPAPIPVTETTTPPPTGWPSAAAQTATAPPSRARRTPERAPERQPAGGCVRPDAAPTGGAQPDLDLRLAGPERMTSTDHPTLSATLRNVSRSRNHHIVLSGDGSDAGWRDPVISFSAFIDEGDGCWRVLERQAIGRCGLFDPDWTDEVVELRAGAKRSLDPLWGFPAFAWRPGKVRLFLHYSWTGGAASKGGATSVDLGRMAREKPYELVSNPIEFVVTG